MPQMRARRDAGQQHRMTPMATTQLCHPVAHQDDGWPTSTASRDPRSCVPLRVISVRPLLTLALSSAMPPPTRDPETYAILGAAMRVHRELGCGFLEAVYHEALGHALDGDGIPWQREVPFRIYFAGQPLRTTYRADLVCFDRVLVELKALRELGGAETAQVLNYLKASGLERALLVNFGAPRLEYRRLVSSPQISQIEERSRR